jgi:hypothetical protein
MLFKPSAGLIILREQVLGAERFDFTALMERWAYKHQLQMISSERWR